MASHLLDRTQPPATAAGGDDADRAIALVLAAERDARAAVAACAQQAERELQLARERAHRIAERGGDRTARIQAAIDLRLARRLAAIEAQRRAMAADAVDSAADAQRRADAVATLAAELTAAGEVGR